jgi:hypothetical protein
LTSYATFRRSAAKQAMQLLDRAASQDESGLFEQKSDLNQLAREQGVSAVVDFESLLGNFWPEDESADDFITQLRYGAKRIGRGAAFDAGCRSRH